MRSFDFPVFTITLEPLASFSTVIQQFSPGIFLCDHCSDSGVLDLANRTDWVDFSPNSSFSDIALEIESTTAALFTPGQWTIATHHGFSSFRTVVC